MPSTLDAITAAGITYKASDYANPNLDRPTALTVTADGRVFGHLAKWGTCHIGHTGQCVSPPSSAQGYKYFHQGVVATEDGDLPVGKLTLGTGHAALGEPATTASAHYDNTGTVVATVRAGEDQHGIWLAGRLVPGAPPERVDELRRSGVSGDWRGIDGTYELVAALAVNVPGFPVPRTEELVASGGVQTLVAAGVVAPPTAEDLQSMVASAVDERVAAELSARDRLARARAQMAALTASAAADRRQALADDMARVQAARAAERMDLTAAAPGDMPEQLRAYWTRGAGLARWAKSAHPYTALVRSLRREITGRPDSMIKGLAANLFKDVFGIWPGQRDSLTAAGGRRVRSQQGAERYNVSVGDLIPKAMLQAQQTAGDFAEAAGNDVAKLLDPARGKKAEPKKSDAKKDDGGDGERMEAHTEPVANADKKSAPKPDEKPKDAAKPSDSETKAEPAAKPDTADSDKEPDNKQGKGNVSEKSKGSTPEPPKKAEAVVESKGGGGGAANSPAPKPTPLASPDGDGVARPAGYPPAESAYADQEVGSPIDTAAPPRLADNGEPSAYMEEDELPAAGANGGALVDYADGMAIYDDGSVTDGTEWTAAAPSMIENAAAARAADMQAAAVDDPTVIQTDVPPRAAGYGAYMEEDQSPELGANGGQLTDYSDGVATYDDGTSTNGVLWRQAEPAAAPPPQPDALAASAHRRALRRIGLSSYPAAWKVA
ncbi:hypothetical protein [Gordonia sp. (in: high G+C Gram-positive bacteria)]|uniref:hypothetical protein n=1 Tax=Gordonia sp. (in: high G+C Gram-positive bacteria) TaxID=84139 RepID=UPI0033422C78